MEGWVELHDALGQPICVQRSQVYYIAHAVPGVYEEHEKTVLMFSSGGLPVTEDYDTVVKYLAGHV